MSCVWQIDAPYLNLQSVYIRVSLPVSHLGWQYQCSKEGENNYSGVDITFSQYCMCFEIAHQLVLALCLWKRGLLNSLYYLAVVIVSTLKRHINPLNIFYSVTNTFNSALLAHLLLMVFKREKCCKK